MKGDKSIESATLLVWIPAKGYIRNKQQSFSVYPLNYLIIEDVKVIKTKLDGMMEAGQAPATAALTAVQTTVMIVSVP